MREPGYRLELESRTDRGKERYSFVSADGVVSTDSFRDSELLLLDTVEPGNNDDILVVQSDIGVPGIVADQAPGGQTLLTETSARAASLSRTNLRENGMENAEARLTGLDQLDRGFDTVLYAPRSYEPVDVAKNRIATAAELLNHGGSLYVAGDQASGINRYERQLREAGGDLEKRSREGQKVLEFTRNDSINLERADTSHSFSAEVAGAGAEFKTADGLFSPGKIDDGTRLLIENVDVKQGDAVLDLACGYGAIGIFLRQVHGCEIFLTDDNIRAKRYAGKNLERNGIDDYRLEAADCLEGVDTAKFDVIVTNPPTHAGKGVIDEMLDGSRRALAENGSLYLVVNSGLGFREKLEDRFDSVDEVASRDKYVVFRAEKLSR